MSIKLRPLSKVKGNRKVIYRRFDFTVEIPKNAMLDNLTNERREEVRRRRVNRALERASKNSSTVEG